MKKLLLLVILVMVSIGCNVDDEMYPKEPEVIEGIDGINCWDLNGNTIGETNEDTNGDGHYDARDCQGTNGSDGNDGSDGTNGDDGSDGTDGTDGENGISCWDLDGDGIADPEEDTNGDGDYNGLDCQGTDGTDGTDGGNCWDTIGDVDGNGTLDSNDCLAWYEAPCSDVYNTEKCGDGERYVIWIDGTQYANINLIFKQFDNGTARLCGNVAQEKNEDIHEIDIRFTRGDGNSIEEPKCIDDFSTEDWIQYGQWSGEVVRTDDGKKFIVERGDRGAPFQIGIDANNQERRPGIYGGSGWGSVTEVISGNGTVTHPNCFIDLQINVCKALKP